MKLFKRCNQLGNKCISTSSVLLVIVILLMSTMLLASIYTTEEDPIKLDPIPQTDNEVEVEVWIPTKEDIAYQDSMYNIIQNTQKDVDTIKADIDRILYKIERIEYSDGTVDSIRYVKGSAIDKRNNQ